MENKLNELFARQRFFGNKKLADIIDDVQERYYEKELSEDDLEMVSAAGEPDISKLRGLTQDKKD